MGRTVKKFSSREMGLCCQGESRPGICPVVGFGIAVLNLRVVLPGQSSCLMLVFGIGGVEPTGCTARDQDRVQRLTLMLAVLNILTLSSESNLIKSVNQYVLIMPYFV